MTQPTRGTGFCSAKRDREHSGKTLGSLLGDVQALHWRRSQTNEPKKERKGKNREQGRKKGNIFSKKKKKRYTYWRRPLKRWQSLGISSNFLHDAKVQKIPACFYIHKSKCFQSEYFCYFLKGRKEWGVEKQLHLLSATFCIELDIKWVQNHHGSVKCHNRDQGGLKKYQVLPFTVVHIRARQINHNTFQKMKLYWYEFHRRNFVSNPTFCWFKSEAVCISINQNQVLHKYHILFFTPWFLLTDTITTLFYKLHVFFKLFLK